MKNQLVQVMNDKEIPILTIMIESFGFILYSLAKIAAVIIGAIAASKTLICIAMSF